MPVDHARPRTLSRRRLLVTGAVAGAAALLPLGSGGPGRMSSAWAASSRRRAPRQVTGFRMEVPARALRGGRVSDVLRAPRRFDLLGLRGSGVRGGGVEIRARKAGGDWSEWAPVEVTRHGPDGRTSLAASDPVWVGGADEFQIRSREPLGGVDVHFVAVPADTRRARPRASASSVARAAQAGGAPPIIGRDVWEAGRCSPRDDPSYGEVRMAFVHHTVSANTYGPEDSAGIVLSICKYHRDSNGWNDIGYNFVVDRYGQVFEGRAGGVDKPVIGAQAEGYNRFSTGVACLGTFTDAGQSPVALDALARLLAWKLATHAVPVAGEVTVVSGGGSTNRFKRGTEVSFDRISGHRDGCSTACPGNALYAQLPEIRARAARIDPAIANTTRISLGAVEPDPVYGEQARFRGRLLLASGAAAAGERVNVQKRGKSGKYTTMARATTGPDGHWDASFTWRAEGRIRATARIDGERSVRSESVMVGLTPSVTAKAATSRIERGQRIRISGRVRPHAAVRVLVEKEGKDGKYERVRESRMRIRRGRFSSGILLRDPGLYRLTVRTGSKESPVEADPLYVRAVRDIEKNPPRETRGESGGASSGASSPSSSSGGSAGGASPG